MKISELISRLEYIKDNHGDLDCYTNGEHGFGDPIEITENEIDFDKAKLTASDTTWIEANDDEVILYIGGC